LVFSARLFFPPFPLYGGRGGEGRGGRRNQVEEREKE